MSGEPSPLTCNDVKKTLKHLGFEPRPQKSISHEQWAKVVDGRLYKATVDCPKAPFSQMLIKSIAEQAWMRKSDFYRIFKQL